MRALSLILISILLFYSCRGKVKVPSHVLSRPQMQAVIWDLVRADEWLKDYVFNIDSTIDRRKESIKMYNEVFKIHHIDKKKFQESFTWYRAHPDFLKIVLDSIYAKVQNLPADVPGRVMRKDSLIN